MRALTITPLTHCVPGRAVREVGHAHFSHLGAGVAMPTGKNLAWMAGIALATILAFENYKAKKSGAGPTSMSSLWGRATG